MGIGGSAMWLRSSALILLLTFVLPPAALAVPPENLTHLWSWGAGSAANEGATSIAATPDGGVVVGGNFGSELSFGGDPLTSNGQFDFFITKRDGSAGEHIWSVGHGGPGVESLVDVVTNADGGVFAAGDFNGTTDLGDGPIENKGFGSDGFVAKYGGTNGAHEWSVVFHGVGAEIEAVTADESGDIIVTSSALHDIEMSNGTLLDGPGYFNLFLLRLDANSGAVVWWKAFGSRDRPSAGGLASSGSGEVAIVGYFGDTISLGGPTLYATGGRVFVAKYRTDSGTHVWSVNGGGSRGPYHTDVSFDVTTQDVYITGTFSRYATFGNTTLSSDAEAGYLVKLASTTGDFLWVREYGDPGTQVQGLVLVEDGLIVAGYLRGADSDFGDAMHSAVGSTDMFLARYSATDGSYVWSTTFGAPNATLMTNDIELTEPHADVSFAGAFRGTIDFGGEELTSVGNTDIFAATVRVSDSTPPFVSAGVYVALGDSFSSGDGAPGPGIPAYEVGTDTSLNRCRRSERAYPRVFAEKYSDVLPFVLFRACRGAVVDNIDAVSQYPGEDPQLTWALGRTRFLSITLGGNDVGFPEVIWNCAGPTPGDYGSCKDYYQRGGSDEISLRIMQLKPTLVQVYRKLRRAAPDARIAVMGYP